MNTDLPPPPVLTLQEKLDWIAHERDVLSLLRELARVGLREGDAVRHVGSGAAGRLQISRDQQPPRLVVRCDDGTIAEYAPACWCRDLR